MAYGIKLKVWGNYACFTRPENKAERVSYDVMTPSAARGILEAIHWKPAITWEVDKIHVLNPIKFQAFRRNEVENKISVSKSDIEKQVIKPYFIEEHRQQRASLFLIDVAYVIEAHFSLTSRADESDSEGKHLDIFNRRARDGKCFHRPYFGCREFSVHFSLLEDDIPISALANDSPRDLGIMLYDIDFKNQMKPIFYRPSLEKGIIDVAKYKEETHDSSVFI